MAMRKFGKVYSSVNILFFKTVQKKECSPLDISYFLTEMMFAVFVEKVKGWSCGFLLPCQTLFLQALPYLTLVFHFFPLTS